MMGKGNSRKKSLGVVIFFVVAFSMGIAFGMVFGYILFSNAKPVNVVVNNNTNTIIDDTKLQKELFDVINNKNLEKVIYNYRANGIEFKEITNDEKLFLAGIDSYYKTSGNWVDINKLKTNLNEKYNTDFGVEGKDYNFHEIATIKYEEGNYTYSGKAFTYVDNQIFIDLHNAEKLEKKDGEYHLTVNGIYHQELKNNNTYSNDKGFIFNEAVSTTTSLDSLFKTNEEEFMKYDFIFGKVNNKYVLKNFQKIK